MAWRDVTLWLLVEGRGSLLGPEGTVAIEPGSCLLLRGGQAYTILPATGIRLVHWYAHFDVLTESGSTRDHRSVELPASVRRLGQPERAVALWERLVDSLPHDRLRAGRWLAALLQEVAVQEKLASQAHPPDRLTEALGDVARRMREDPADAHRIATCAKRIGLGRDQFRRRFQELHGSPPREYLTAQRLRLAEHLLTDSSATISAIAAQTGYANPYFFSRHFRRHAGCSPSQFRRRLGRSRSG